MKKQVILALVAATPLVIAGCEVAPKTSTQNGYRGTGMDTIMIADSAAADKVPAPPYEMPGNDGPLASEVYENVTVLGGISVDQFNYTMAALTEWVSPEEGCNYCHNPADMASDEVYTKVVARQMLQMTIAINESHGDHVGQTGVTCYTCHRGENVPSESWTLPALGVSGIVGNRSGQNKPVSNSSYSSLPTASVASYLLGGIDVDDKIRVASEGMYPSNANRLTTMETEHSYALMMHISQALGVNCTYCHNAQSFQSWADSNPSRETAWYGLGMVRDINANHITPLAGDFPANRLGEMGDPFKVNCTTCHRGQNKPLGGAQMARDYPALWTTTLLAPLAAESDDADDAGDQTATE